MYNIMIVDDEEPIPRTIARLLKAKRLDYKVGMFNDPIAALDALKAAKESPLEFAVILSDLRMPMMKGDELLYHASVESPNTSRLIMTATPEDLSESRYDLSAIVHEILIKPFETDEILRVLRESCERYDLRASSMNRRMDP